VAKDESTGLCVASVDHEQPIEAGIAFPGSGMFASAGGTVVKIWDFPAGGRLVQSLSGAHSKVVSGLALDSTASVLLTSSFDGYAKTHNAADLTHLWTYKLPAPGTCAAWRPDDRAFAVGLDNGQCHFRYVKSNAKADAGVVDKDGVEADHSTEKLGDAPPKQGKRKLERATNKADSDEEVVQPALPRKKRENNVDFFLRKFEYGKVLQVIMVPTTSSNEVLSIVDELLKRKILGDVLSDLSEESCIAVLLQLTRAFGGGEYLQQNLVFEALHTLLDKNPCLQPPKTPQLINALQKLEVKVCQEMKIQEVLTDTSGMLKAIAGL